MAENSYLTQKNTPNHGDNALDPLVTTPVVCPQGVTAELHTEGDEISQLDTNHDANPRNIAPRPMENEGFIVTTPEIVCRPPITIEAEAQFDEGYDSDRCMGPFLDAIDQEGDQLADEVEVPEMGHTGDIEQNDEILAERNTLGASQPSTNQPQIVHIEFDKEIVKKLKVDELRHQLKM